MNVYPNDIEYSLGFDQIRHLLIRFCQSEKGEWLAKKLKPTDKISTLTQWHNQTKEMIGLKTSEGEKVLFQFPAIEGFLARVKVSGSFLSPEDFHELKIGLGILISWTGFFREKPVDYPELSALSNHVEVDPKLLKAIEFVIDEKGKLKDNASPELLQTRAKIAKTERSVRSAVQKVLKKAKQDQLAEEDSALTIRDGRLVIPVKAEFKKRIPGFVHDESATGQTVFLEPSDVLDLNNEVRELRYAEKREIARILMALSDAVRADLEELKKGSGLLEKLDLIYAKARLADHIHAIIPNFKKKQAFQWINAVHPLLYLAHKASGKGIVPLSIQLDFSHRILIISGPNAGGKSIVLKTVGLLQYMFQCGLPVPVGEESEFGVFSHIFMDIGDAQSIEDDLSTYSSHLVAIKHFLKYANNHTLFLIDEFGKGTEPQFGGAIAESVLLELNKTKSFGLVTTHYQNLKKMGEDIQGMVNGAMKYNLNELEPLFELEVGKPGSSFTFEIARKIGLPNTIIEGSKEKTGSVHVAYDRLLNQLEKEKAKYEKLSKQVTSDRKDLEKARIGYVDLRYTLDVERNQIVKEAKQEAQQILSEANRDVERVIREIQESKASKERTKKLRAELSRKSESLVPEKQNKHIELKQGDTVKMEGQDLTGTVQKVKGKQVEVLFGGIKSIVSADHLAKSRPDPQHKHQKKVKKLGIDLTGKMAVFNHELSIRGLRAEEAMGKVEPFIDEALLLGIDEVRIIHGKGHGILREIVRNYTRDHPRVKSVADGHADRGGAGISIIRLA